MLDNETVDAEQSLVAVTSPRIRAIEVPGAPPVRLQTLDMARHIAIDPSGQRYVVATFDDTHMRDCYITAIYPQQNGYLTLFRLVLCELQSQTAEDAEQQHRTVIQAIQQGKLKNYTKSA